MILFGIFSGYLLTRLKDWQNDFEDKRKAKKSINYDLNGIMESWIEQYKIYTIYLKKYENKILWIYLSEKNMHPVKSMNFSVISSQFELLDIVKQSGILVKIDNDDLIRILTIETHVKKMDKILQLHKLREGTSINEQIFYKWIGTGFLKKKISIFEAVLFSLSKNSKAISWFKITKENKKFFDSFKSSHDLSSSNTFDSIIKDYSILM